jgi:hypothetical protein
MKQMIGLQHTCVSTPWEKLQISLLQLIVKQHGEHPTDRTDHFECQLVHRRCPKTKSPNSPPTWQISRNLPKFLHFRLSHEWYSDDTQMILRWYSVDISWYSDDTQLILVRYADDTSAVHRDFRIVTPLVATIHSISMTHVDIVQLHISTSALILRIYLQCKLN